MYDLTSYFLGRAGITLQSFAGERILFSCLLTLALVNDSAFLLDL